MFFKCLSVIMGSVMFMQAQYVMGVEDFDPRRDLRLHPAKGATIFVREEVVPYSYVYFGKNYTVDCPESHEITVSYPAWGANIFNLCYGLLLFNTEKRGHIETSVMIVNGIELGVSLQKTLVLTELDALGGSTALLSGIEKNAFSRGIRRIHGTVSAENIPLQEALAARGFIKDNAVLDLKTGQYSYPVFKELRDFHDDVLSDDMTIEWKIQVETLDSDFGRCFGIFVRDLERGLFQGGLFGKLLIEEAKIPHSYIEGFWLDERLRGMGFGRTIMDIALNFSKQEGASIVALSTYSDQAPDFYPKAGFTPVHISKPLFQSPEGDWVNEYTYRKDI